MRHVHAEARVEAPVKHVFDLACDPERLPEWNPYQRIDDVRGPLDHVGTTLAPTLTLLGHEVHSLAVVTEVVRNRLVRIHGTGPAGGHSEWTYRFEPDGDATRWSIDVDYEMPGVMRGVVDLLVYHGALERATRHMTENFAAVAEAKVPLLA